MEKYMYYYKLKYYLTVNKFLLNDSQIYYMILRIYVEFPFIIVIAFMHN